MKKWLGWVLFAGVLLVSGVAGGAVGLFGTSQTTRSVTPVEPTKDEIERQKIAQALLTDGPIAASKLKLQVSKGLQGWRTSMEADSDDGKLASVLQDARGLFLALSDTKVDIDQADVKFRTSALRDTYGKAMKDLTIAQITISAATWKKVDWKGFDPRNFPAIADKYTLHPLLQKQPLPPPRPDNAAMIGVQGQAQQSQGQGGSSGAEQGKGKS